jgi:hypothetical protein
MMKNALIVILVAAFTQAFDEPSCFAAPKGAFLSKYMNLINLINFN